MSGIPQYGQRSEPTAAPECPRHPGVRAVDYCKRCKRPMCAACAIPTEVRSICVDCAQQVRRRVPTGSPVVTTGIIVACAVVYAIGWVSPALERALMFAPVLGYHQPWRFLTTAFLHASLWHIGFNMLALYWVGRSLERVMGHWRFAVLYVLSAVGGSLAVLLWCFVQPSTWMTATVGASGAVFGLFAAVFVLQHLSGADTTSVLVLLGINLVYGLITPGISWQAHVGGLVTGLVVAWVFARLARPRRGMTERTQTRLTVGAAVAMALVLAGLVSVTYALLLS
ncbi:rhomboid family intramembrane serine protease [Actinomyces polynesiensis]|uniref:rhomboid family intramembrane serine protease n=1 Tax=Actinomyces polynesiensis TaxID=1325934 RepID=UPI0005BB61E1|nr:rhomboid family intramembrane serine protease [Actinomyces polynesiensis]